MEENIIALLDTLKNGKGWFERRQAARMLRKNDSSEVIEALKEAVHDLDEEVAQAAVLSLLHLNYEDVNSLVTRPRFVLSDSSSLRWTAAHALHKFGDRTHFDFLLRMSNDADWSVRDEVASSLEVILDRLKDEQAIVDEVKSHKDVKLLIRMLQLKQKNIRSKIIHAIISYDLDIAQRHLLEALHSENVLVKTGVIKALGTIGHQRIVEHLIVQSMDQSSIVRLEVVKAVGKIGGYEAINILINKLKDVDIKVVSLTMDILRRLKTDPALTKILIDRLKNVRSIKMRANILHVMGDIRDPEMVPEIFNCMGNSYYFIRQAAVRALVKFGDIVNERLMDSMSVNPLDIKPLMAIASQAGHPHSRVQALKLIAKSRNPDAIKFLVLGNLASDPKSEVRNAAEATWSSVFSAIWERANCAYALGEIGNEESAAPLIEALGDWSIEVRATATVALQKLRVKDSALPLSESAKTESDPVVRGEMIAALGAIGCYTDQIKQVIFNSMKDNSVLVRRETARVLGNITDDPAAAQLLINSLTDASTVVKDSVFNALYTIGESILPDIRKSFLERKEMHVRFYCMNLIGIFNDKSMIPSIEKMIKSDNDPVLVAQGELVLKVIRSEQSKNRRKLFYII